MNGFAILAVAAAIGCHVAWLAFELILGHRLNRLERSLLAFDLRPEAIGLRHGDRAPIQ
jgi:hypothetical protein